MHVEGLHNTACQQHCSVFLQSDIQPACAVRQGVSFIQDGSQAVDVVKPRTPGYPFLPLAFSLLYLLHRDFSAASPVCPP